MTYQDLSRRSFLNRAGLVVGASVAAPMLLAGCGETAGSKGGSKGGATDVAYQLGWLLDHGQLGEAVAIEKGYFADNGLNVTIRPGGPSIDGLSLVASGQSKIGQISSSPSIMLARSQDIPVKCVGVGVQKHPYAYASKPDKPVREPKDLIGKTVGTQATGQVLLSALLAENDIDPKDVNVVVVGADMTPLTTGQVDVLSIWQTDVAVLRPLGELGKDYFSMLLWDSGIQLYANIYYTTDTVLGQNKDELTKYFSAAGEGWAYARNNLDEAVDALAKLSPSIDKDDMKAQAEALMTFTFNDDTKANGWATMEPAIWQRQIDMWDELGQFKKAAPAVDDVMTLDILEATADSRPKVG